MGDRRLDEPQGWAVDAPAETVGWGEMFAHCEVIALGEMLRWPDVSGQGAMLGEGQMPGQGWVLGQGQVQGEVLGGQRLMPSTIGQVAARCEMAAPGKVLGQRRMLGTIGRVSDGEMVAQGDMSDQDEVSGQGEMSDRDQMSDQDEMPAQDKVHGGQRQMLSTIGQVIARAEMAAQAEALDQGRKLGGQGAEVPDDQDDMDMPLELDGLGT